MKRLGRLNGLRLLVVVTVVAAAALAGVMAITRDASRATGTTGTTGGAATARPAPDARVVRDVAYAPAQPATSRGHLLDLYLPAGQGGRVPLVIWTGGSGWLSDGGKDSARPIAEAFTAKGYAVAGVSIRSSDQAVFPAQVHDIKAAIRWLRANSDRYGLDAQRFAVMGDSSGGWTTSMAALTGDVPELEGAVGVTGASSAVQAAVAFYGPVDFLQMNTRMLPGACTSFNASFDLENCHDDPQSPESRLVGCPIQSCPERAAVANPIRYASRNDPPLAILHGQADRFVPHAQSVQLYEALRAACADAAFTSVPNAGHDWYQVLDPANQAPSVARTSGCREQRTASAPNPSWDTIEEFIAESFERR